MRNAYLLWISPEYILNLFRSWNPRPGFLVLPRLEQACDMTTGQRVAIPHDVVVRAVDWDFPRLMFGLMIEHENFPPVPLGQAPPSLVLDLVTVEVRQVIQPGPDDPIVVEVS